MNILFIVYHGLSPYSGISKKILFQVKGFRVLGHNVFLYTYDFDNKGNKIRKINNETIDNLGKSVIAPIKKRIDYKPILSFVQKNKIDFVYARSFHNANPFLIRMFRSFKKAGIKSVIEIPTYPYDKEYYNAPLHIKLEFCIDKLYRKKLAQETNAIVTFSNETKIFGQRTIQISNGIDFDSFPLKTKNSNTKEINLIGVAEVHFWHGFDRVIAGIGEYYQKAHSIDVFFHVVGGIADTEMYGSRQSPGFHSLIKKYNIEKYIIFYGQKNGKELDDIFEKCDFAIGSLGRHRTGISKIKTLKNREYAARGIPFIYSESDDDFDEKPYIIKAPANNSPLIISDIITFYKNLKISPQQIRDSIKSLSWINQMNKVLNNI